MKESLKLPCRPVVFSTKMKKPTKSKSGISPSIKSDLESLIHNETTDEISVQPLEFTGAWHQYNTKVNPTGSPEDMKILRMKLFYAGDYKAF
jgi:hypothetical protein